ncbi:MAG: AraC family transcriptional regulator [Ruminococcus sp.]|nr:AraC family transcriptional regulator [Ruminococcus sp.]
MRIDRIRLNCRRDKPFPAELGSVCSMYYFRSPVLSSGNGTDESSDGGAAIVLPGGTHHEFRPAERSSLKYDCITFRMNAAEKQYVSSLGIPFGRLIPVTDDYVISGILRCMRSQSISNMKNNAEFMELAFRLILLSLSGCISGEQTFGGRLVPRYAELKAIREAIYEDPAGEWSSEILAEDMGISRVYFHRIYLEAFGVTCRQDVIESRLIRASELLRNTGMSVGAVAEQCGYESESYFMRQFKQHKGCTPSEYRNAPEREE